jgi:hypothetical protein
MRPRYDARYAVEVQRAHSGRFAIVNPVDPDDPAVADVVADWKKTPGTVGIRIIPDEGGGARAKRSGARRWSHDVSGVCGWHSSRLEAPSA